MVTSAVVPAITPSPRRGAGHPGQRTGSARPLPVPALPDRPVGAAAYGLAILDRYGRLADRAVLRALGWGPGHPLALRACWHTL